MAETQEERNERISREENRRAAEIQETVGNCGTCGKPVNNCQGHG